MITSKVLDKIFINKYFKKSINITKYKNTTNNICNSTLGITYDIPMIQTSYAIDNIPPNGIILNNAGTYIFNSDINWTPVNNAIAITINSNNVVVNLNNYKLICLNSNNNNIIGIMALGNNIIPLINTSVINGEIENMSLYGIKISYGLNIKIHNMTINKLEYVNLNIRYLTPTGIFLEYSNNISIYKSTVKNTAVKTDSCAGIQLVECYNGLIKKCSITNLTNYDGAVQGYSYIGSQNIKTIDCISSKFKSYLLY